jgi:hypothetical protein
MSDPWLDHVRRDHDRHAADLAEHLARESQRRQQEAEREWQALVEAVLLLS